MAARAFANVDPRLLASSGAKRTLAFGAGLQGFSNQVASAIQQQNKVNAAQMKSAQRGAEYSTAVNRNITNVKNAGAKSLLNRPPDDDSSIEDDIYVDSKGHITGKDTEGAKKVNFEGSEALYKPDFKSQYANPTERKSARKEWRSKKREYVNSRLDKLLNRGEESVKELANEIRLGDLPAGKRNRVLKSLGGANEDLLLQGISAANNGKGLSKYAKNYDFWNAYNQNPQSLTRVIERDGSATFKVMGADGDYYSVASNSLGVSKGKDGKPVVTGFSSKDDLQLLPSDFQDRLEDEGKKYGGGVEGQYKAFQAMIDEDPSFLFKSVEMLEGIIDPSKLSQFDTNKTPGLQPEEIARITPDDIWTFYVGYNTQQEREAGLVNIEDYAAPILTDIDTLKGLDPNKKEDVRKIESIQTRLSSVLGEPVVWKGDNKISIGSGDDAREFDLGTLDGKHSFTLEGAEEAGLDQRTIEALSPFLEQRRADIEDKEIREGEQTIRSIFTNDGLEDSYEIGSITGNIEEDIKLADDWIRRVENNVPSEGILKKVTGPYSTGGWDETPIPKELRPAYDFFSEFGYIPQSLVNPASSIKQRQGAYNVLIDNAQATRTNQSNNAIVNNVLPEVKIKPAKPQFNETIKDTSFVNIGGQKSKLRFDDRETEGVDPVNIELLNTEMVNLASDISNEIDIPVVITSGYRSEDKNTSVGGVKGSAHLEGKAMDIRTKGLTNDEVLKIIESFKERGFEVVDERDKKGSPHLHVVYKS